MVECKKLLFHPDNLAGKPAAFLDIPWRFHWHAACGFDGFLDLLESIFKMKNLPTINAFVNINDAFIPIGEIRKRLHLSNVRLDWLQLFSSLKDGVEAGRFRTVTFQIIFQRHKLVIDLKLKTKHLKLRCNFQSNWLKMYRQIIYNIRSLLWNWKVWNRIIAWTLV